MVIAVVANINCEHDNFFQVEAPFWGALGLLDLDTGCFKVGLDAFKQGLDFIIVP